MAGVLLEAGRGRVTPDDVATMLNTKSDMPAQKTVPPSGLFLERVYYKGDPLNLEVRPVFNLR